MQTKPIPLLTVGISDICWPDVTVAQDGQEALDKVKQSMEEKKRFDLIFMDVQVSQFYYSIAPSIF